jgi:hypothetical protein
LQIRFQEEVFFAAANDSLSKTLDYQGGSHQGGGGHGSKNNWIILRFGQIGPELDRPASNNHIVESAH